MPTLKLQKSLSDSNTRFFYRLRLIIFMDFIFLRNFFCSKKRQRIAKKKGYIHRLNLHKEFVDDCSTKRSLILFLRVFQSLQP